MRYFARDWARFGRFGGPCDHCLLLFFISPPVGHAPKIFSKCVRVPVFDCIAIFFRTAGTAPREHGQYRQQFARA
jgi:hypothetical protein